MPITQIYFTEEARKSAIRASKQRYYEKNREKYNAISNAWGKAHYNPEKKRAYYLAKKAEKAEKAEENTER